MDVIINNPAQSAAPQTYIPQTYAAPTYGYGPGYGQGYGPGYGGHPGGGFGFILLALLGVFIFLRWNRGRGRGGWGRGGQGQGSWGQGSWGRGGGRWAMNGGPGGTAGRPEADPSSAGDWRPPRFPWSRDPAADIARERFARGEINERELSGLLRALDGSPDGQQERPHQEQ